MRTIYTATDGKKHIILPYTGFRMMGVADEVPQVAVPYYEDISSAIAEPIRHVAEYEDSLAANQFVHLAGAALRRNDGGTSTSHELDYEEKLAVPRLIFRGESHEVHGLMPTMFRIREPGLYAVMQHRLRLERRRARLMQLALFLQKGVCLNPDQSRAAARHFGAPSPFLDFSFDPRVAAFFGHPALAPLEKAATETTALGILYMLSFATLEANFHIQGYKPLPSGGLEITFYNIVSGWRLPYLGFNPERNTIEKMSIDVGLPPGLGGTSLTFRAILVPSVTRIRRQQGVFVEIQGGGQPNPLAQLYFWYLIDFLCEKWCYRRGDHAYEDPSAGVTATSLLPDEGFIIRATSRYVSSRHR